MSSPTSRPPSRLEVRETHSAGLLLAGDRAYKFKKPVDLGFLDFTDPATRWAVSVREVELNRRFAPDVYLGVADVALPDEEHEPVVVMRRMPDDRRLSTLVVHGRDVAEPLRQVARSLAVVHGRSPHGPVIDEEAGLARLRARWQASFLQTRSFARRVLDPEVAHEIERLTLRFLDGRAPLFARRVADRRAVDGHGDLLADDIFCLPDGPRVLDCLEFDDRLRYVDGADDAAFLAMDLERLGRADLGAMFLGWYAEFAGDPAPPSLLHHYIAYRAFVRAKVCCLRFEQGDADSKRQADELSRCALRHLQADSVSMVLVGGPPGSGKTTVAARVADRLGATLVSSDRVRKELAGLDPMTAAAASYGTGAYAPEMTVETYDELLDRARVLTGLGETVVLDATWTSGGHRAQARELARETSTDLLEVQCHAPTSVCEARIRTRMHASSPADATSDADTLVAARLREVADPWPQSVRVDTTGDLVATVEAVTRLVRPQADVPPRLRRPTLAPD